MFRSFGTATQITNIQKDKQIDKRVSVCMSPQIKTPYLLSRGLNDT